MRKEIKLDHGKVISNKSTFIIAEIGSNHCNEIELALKSIDTAADCGADAIKFQSLNVKKQYHNPSEELIDLHKKIDLPESWYEKLKEKCDQRKVIFVSSPTYKDSIDLLQNVDVCLYKIASAQVATSPYLVSEIAKKRKPVILSTGLVELSDLENMIKIFKKYKNENYIILHCNSIYPAPAEKVYLKRMVKYSEYFKSFVGFSDHTENNLASLSAVSLGASVIEKHFTLSKNFDSPDAKFAYEPKEFAEFVDQIKETNMIIQFKERNYLETEEIEFKSKIRNFLISTKAIPPNKKIDSSNSTFVRGEGGFLEETIIYNDKEIYAKNFIKENCWIKRSDLI